MVECQLLVLQKYLADMVRSQARVKLLTTCNLTIGTELKIGTDLTFRDRAYHARKRVFQGLNEE